MIEISELTKNYSNKKALDQVSTVFEQGKIYGVLGSNGAGKTTLMRIITNRVFPTSGQVRIAGQNATENEEAQKLIFCVTERDKYPKDLNAEDLFRWVGRFYSDFDIPYARKLAERFDFDTKKRVKTLSTGYYTIFKVIMSLASNAPIMILDEPVLGIDSLYREIFYDVLLEHHKEKKTLVLISTHLIAEVERVLDEVVIIHQGKIITHGKKADMTKNGERLNDVYIRILKEARDEE
ncbi:ABC transporter ATP-binding protein [Lactococcus garvieae]|uniref:ABC transporter ATP-binding protein n=1 Tax=Lactococcus garvieae TaxID=1363 RepID=UPI0009C032AB|nr:ABC transporter ATP-binding protein [Lactococcus garvieae]